MAQSAEKADLKDRMLVLGFDGGCFACSDIAARIRGQVGDRLVVRSLKDPELQRWRLEALGEDALWAPTLFEIKEGRVRAWTGWEMAMRLGRLLGPVASWRVLQVLGEVGSLSRIDGSPVTERHLKEAATSLGGLSRGQFLKGMGGAAVAVSALSGVSLFPSLARAEESTGTLEQQSLARSIVRNSQPYLGMADQQAAINATFDWSQSLVKVNSTGSRAKVEVHSIGTRAVVTSYDTRLTNKSLDTVATMAARNPTSTRTRVMSWVGASAVERFGTVHFGDNYVITSDNRILTHQQFTNELAMYNEPNVAISSSRTGQLSRQQDGEWWCTDEQYSTRFRTYYNNLKASKELVCYYYEVKDGKEDSVVRFFRRWSPSGLVCELVTDDYLANLARQRASRDCSYGEPTVTQASPIYKC